MNRILLLSGEFDWIFSYSTKVKLTAKNQRQYESALSGMQETN